MAAALAAAAAGGTISALGTLGATLGAADIQSKTATQTNQTNLNFQKSMIDRGEHSFTDIGLPSAMYWGGNSITSPNSLIHLGGSNFYEQSGVNSNLPFIGVSPYMQYNHTGQPKNIGNSNKNLPSSMRQTFVKSTTDGTPGNPLGQSDRAGLGSGRYNNVPPPAGLYNSRGAQTELITHDQATQYATRVNNSTTMTSGLTKNQSVQASVFMTNSGFSPGRPNITNTGTQATGGPGRTMTPAFPARASYGPDVYDARDRFYR